MLVIVEGIDRVGKTTLCNKLAKEFGFKIFKEDKRRIRSKELLSFANYGSMQSIVNCYKVFGDNLVLDRFHLTEYVYGTIDRKVDSKMAFQIFGMTDKKVSTLGEDVFLVLVMPTNLESSSAEHGSDLSEHEKLFENCFDFSSIKNKVIVDYKTLDNAIRFVKSKLEAK